MSTNEPIPVFLGFDAAQSLAWAVAAHSIRARASAPVAIQSLRLDALRPIFDRPRDPKQSTDFAFTRFLVPHLMGYRGFAIYADCDVLMLRDVATLWALRDETRAVQVVQHDHRPRERQKFLGHVQTGYPRKNWSSLMLFNAARCAALTPGYVGSASGLDLHQFRWLDDAAIGGLPREWNHLVDYDPPRPLEEIAMLHFTQGGPWLADYAACGYADVWRRERVAMEAANP